MYACVAADEQTDIITILFSFILRKRGSIAVYLWLYHLMFIPWDLANFSKNHQNPCCKTNVKGKDIC